jgi:hypothetical protein
VDFKRNAIVCKILVGKRKRPVVREIVERYVICKWILRKQVLEKIRLNQL